MERSGEPLDGEILGPEKEGLSGNERRVRTKFWTTLARAAGQVPFMEDLIAAYYCAFDPKTPHRVRAVLIGALAYFVLPLDTIPDFIALFGFSDDVAVLTAVIASVRSNISERHREAARRKLESFRNTGTGSQKPAGKNEAA